MRAIPTAIILTLTTACMATQRWVHQETGALAGSAQYRIDSAECEAYAMSAVDVPEVTEPRPASYSTTGTVVDNYGNSATYSSNTSERSSNPIADGIADSQQMAERSRAIRARKNIADACMLRRGWRLDDNKVTR